MIKYIPTHKYCREYYYVRLWRQRFEGVKISSSIPSKNSIQERQSIIAQAAARGLQLSDDGRIWVPIHPESNQVMVAENEPSKYSVSSYVGASILGVVLGILLVVLYFAISVFALIIGVYFVLILPISLLAGDYVSLGEFLFGIF